jgi:hypothetical protein
VARIHKPALILLHEQTARAYYLPSSWVAGKAMREFTRRYGRGIINALKSLQAQAKLLGAPVLAWVRRQWVIRDHLLRQGGRWIGRHKLSVSAVLVAIASLWLIRRIDWPDEVLSWTF